MKAALNKQSPRVLSILRIMTGLLFVAHGTQKILNFPAPPEWEVATFSMPWIAGMMELFGGSLIVLGLFTRPVAFLLSGLMASAYFIAHAPASFYPILNAGDAAILYCFVFLYFVFSGPGCWSLDAKMGRE
ncbi:DoxX family protein [Ruegeria arenilitoris]|uniref:DoxX family protein n=1 Tax=Ruegeria arenilitoris TaxID=1173585 RepID=UPI00147C850E|nr:DoxX family protein [Ruegeria arenilitoris]